MDFNQNYFQIMGVPVDYDVDLDALGERFLDLQKQVHPDKFASASEQEKRLSMQRATLVNSANETLRSPLKRALYLLELKGVTIAENPNLSPAFLMEQIELRERLEDIESAAEPNLDELDEFKSSLTSVIKSVQSRFGSAIEADPGEAEQLVYELQFLNKLLIAAKEVEERVLEY